MIPLVKMSDAANPSLSRPLGLYVHWPFCRSKCPYCDFNSHVANDVNYDAYGDALCREMAHMASLLDAKRPLHSIFFGGGTPSLMPPETVERVISTARELFGFTETIEITSEANPTSVEASNLASFKAAGVNRVSMGVQSLAAENLAFLGREHSGDEAMAALDVARSVFDRVSIDLIYGLPNQTMAAWETDLSTLFALGLDHLSLYQLTIEQGTVFYTRQRRGETMTANDERAADMFDMTHRIARANGLPAYEISNFAAPGSECRHNLIYWRAQDWIGIGPGAHGRILVGEKRIGMATRRSPQGWLDAVRQQGHGIDTELHDGTDDQIAEIMMMGLRLNEGVDLQACEARFGDHTQWLNQDNLARALENNLITIEPRNAGQFMRATDNGRLFLNQLLADILL
ncbi:radical SAM family heme chaperone HemW [Alphaproteobacteria bacterium]|nr:radical SAM family heme chaperone HemW [Alphaproteobacteria bacterium]